MPANQLDADTLLDDIREIAEALGRTPTSREYHETSDHAVTTLRRHFGSWNAALDAAGLEPNMEWGIPDDRLLDDIQRVADCIGRSPSMTDYDEHGRYSSKNIQDRLGWNDAKERAGLVTTGPETSRVGPAALLSADPVDLGLSPFLADRPSRRGST